MRSIVSRITSIVIISFCAGCEQTSGPDSLLSDQLLHPPQPRGDVRIVYVSDHDSDMKSVLTDQATAAQLRRHVDMLADNGVDIFAQDIFQKQGVGWFQPQHPDHAHFKGQTDVISRDEGPPIAIAIDQSHKRGMKFLAAFRMADRHGGAGQGLISKRKDLWNPDFPNVAAMDYTHDEVRDWVFALIDEILHRFDIDGFEFTYTRWMHTFPRATARESHPIMTKFVRRVRERIDSESEKRGRHLILGVRVPQTLEECHALGYDVPTWISDGLVDYVSPCDFFFTDFNAKYEEFAALTRGTSCRLYPAVHPLLSRPDEVGIMRPQNYRAAARNMYAAGADGISQFNYQYHWGRRRSGYPWGPGNYPQALAWLRQIRGTPDFDDLPRDYLFLPLWPAGTPTGFLKNDRIVLERKAESRGEYRFRIAEDLAVPGLAAELIVSVVSAKGDRLAFTLNGALLPDVDIKERWHGDGRPAKFGRPMKPYRAYMIPLTTPPAVFGDNVLSAVVTDLDPDGEGPIAVEELQVTVVPPWRK